MARALKLYVHNWIFGKASLADVIARGSSIWFDGIELVGEPAVYNGPEVKQLVEGHGLEVYCFCGLHPGPDP